MFNFNKLIKPKTEHQIAYEEACEKYTLASSYCTWCSPNNPTHAKELIRIYHTVDYDTLTPSKELYLEICGYSYYLKDIIHSIDKHLEKGKYGFILDENSWVPDGNLIIKKLLQEVQLCD